MSALYVMQTERGHLKLGRSRNVEQRQAQLQTGSPEGITLVAVVPRAGFVEPLLHRVFRTESLGNEWYPVASHASDFVECLLHITDDGENAWPSDVLRALAFILDRMERGVPCQQGKREQPPIGELYDAQFHVVEAVA